MKRFLINGNIPIINEDGEVLGKHTVGSTMHEALWKNTSHDTLKCYDFGLELKRKGILDLDESDFRFVEEVVLKCSMMAQFKAPVIRALNSAKDAAKEAKE